MADAEIKQILDEINEVKKITLIGAKNVLTLDEVAMYIGVSTDRIYQLTRTQSIPHYKPRGKMNYFLKEEIDRWLTRNPVKTREDIEKEASTYIATHKKS